MKKWTTALLILLMIFSLVACEQENAGNGEEMPTDTTIEETTGSLSEDAASDETDAVEAVSEATEEDAESESSEDLAEDAESEPTEGLAEDSASEPAEEATEDEASESNEEATEDSASEPADVGEEEAVDENTSDANVNGGGNETPSSETSSEEASVTTPPVTESEPVTTPIIVENDESLAFSGSVTLPSGLTIRTLNEFNSAGMNTSFDNSWFGDVNSDVAAQNYGTMIDNFDAFNDVYGDSAINVTSYERIEWRASLADATGALELRKADDHYKIIIRGPYLDLTTAQSMGWTGLDSYRVAMSQEALVVLLSTISSTPQEIQSAIIQTLYTAPAGQEPIDTNGNWTSIGDCRIMVSAYDFTNGNHIVVFRIAP